jgi:hypothetical protein
MVKGKRKASGGDAVERPAKKPAKGEVLRCYGVSGVPDAWDGTPVVFVRHLRNSLLNVDVASVLEKCFLNRVRCMHS